jgi:thioredoxin 1
MKLVHFTAEWCQPCKTMQPVIEEFINEYQNLDYIKIDIDKDKEMYDEYTKNQAVMSVPTFFAMKDDEILHTQVGATTKDVLANLFI